MSSSETCCVVCLETFRLPVRLTCGHIFCQTCWNDTRQNNLPCPLCRYSHSGPGIPDTEMQTRVIKIPRERLCGIYVSDEYITEHERECTKCILFVNKELKTMVHKLIRHVMVLKKQNQSAVRVAKRARDESTQHREEAERVAKRMRERELRTLRRQNRMSRTLSL